MFIHNKFTQIYKTRPRERMSIYQYDNTFMGGYVDTNDQVYANMGQRQTPFYGKRFGVGGDYGPPSLYVKMSSARTDPLGMYTPDTSIIKDYISPLSSRSPQQQPPSKITFPGSNVPAQTIFSSVERKFGGAYETLFVPRE